MIKKDKTKEERINAELKRLTKLFADIPSNQYAIVKPLIANSAFMAVTLEDLQTTINANGTSDTYQNGNNQFGTKASAELQAYNSLVKNYAMVQEKLTKLLPKESEKKVQRFAEID